MAVFTLDGKEYKVGVTKIDREFELVEGDNTMTAKTGREIRGVRGTAYRFTVHIDMRIIAPEEYDALYWALSAPVDYHDVTFPFGQSTLSFRAGIESGEDTLKRFTDRRRWGNLAIRFKPEKPQRMAGES